MRIIFIAFDGLAGALVLITGIACGLYFKLEALAILCAVFLLILYVPGMVNFNEGVDQFLGLLGLKPPSPEDEGTA